MELGYEVVKTKHRPYWHRKDGGGLDYPVSQASEEKDESDKQTEAQIEHPHMVVEHCPEELHDIPDEGTALVRYKVSTRSKSEKDGKKTHNIVIDIKSFDPQKKADRKRDRMSDYMDGRMHARK